MKRFKNEKKEKKAVSLSLKLKLFVVMLCGLLIASALFIGVYGVGNFVVWRHFANLTDAEIRAIEQSNVEDLQKFININRLYIKDVDRVSEWKSSKHLELVFYQDRDLIYFDETNQGGDNFEDFLTEDAKKQYDETLKNILEGNVDAYPVSFADGTLLVTIVDGTESFWQSVVLVSAILLSLLVLMLIMLVYFTNVTRRIRALANTVQKVEAGEMDTLISDKGRDEIGKLAFDVNSMRNAVVENMSKEREAWEANAGLITAMSHDIRTPLTVLLGYLELLELQNTDPANDEYLESCRQNALKLKKLSDDMFSYFLVFGKRDVEFNFVTVDSDSTINHMLEEHCVLLSEMGYNINCNFEAKNSKVNIDTIYFNRVIDNVFSNVGKYADIYESVDVNTYVEDKNLVISISNQVAKDTSGTESNGIGLKTCIKIMEQFSGSFEAHRENNKFISKITLPLVLKNNTKGGAGK